MAEVGVLDEPVKHRVERLDSRVKSTLAQIRKEVEKPKRTPVELADENYDFILSISNSPVIKSALETNGSRVSIVQNTIAHPAYNRPTEENPSNYDYFVGLYATQNGIEIKLFHKKEETYTNHPLSRETIQEDWDKGNRGWIKKLASMNKVDIVKKFEKALS